MQEVRHMTDSEKLDLILEKVSNLDAKVSNLDTKVVDLDTKVVDLDTKVVDLDTKVVDLDAKVVDLDTRVASLDTRVASLDTRVATLETDMQAIKHQVTKTNLIIENEIRVNIQRVAEGHLDLSRKLNECIKLSSDIKDKQEIQDIFINMHNNKLKAL